MFWIAGKGWVKARELRDGMTLHTLRGTVAVESIQEGEPQTTYGVAMADFHTFFVGKDAILTHDNTIHPPTDRLVPGLARERKQRRRRRGRRRVDVDVRLRRPIHADGLVRVGRGRR